MNHKEGLTKKKKRNKKSVWVVKKQGIDWISIFLPPTLKNMPEGAPRDKGKRWRRKENKKREKKRNGKQTRCQLPKALTI